MPKVRRVIALTLIVTLMAPGLLIAQETEDSQNSHSESYMAGRVRAEN